VANYYSLLGRVEELEQENSLLRCRLEAFENQSLFIEKPIKFVTSGQDTPVMCPRCETTYEEFSSHQCQSGACRHCFHPLDLTRLPYADERCCFCRFERVRDIRRHGPFADTYEGKA